jgi:hypothetical protein
MLVTKKVIRIVHSAEVKEAEEVEKLKKEATVLIRKKTTSNLLFSKNKKN